MKVSIITVVYNNAATISSAIESVLKQTYDNIEYIIIDGKSTDGTMDVVNTYKDKIDVIVSEKDKGLYDAMNKGVEIASGDLVGILNSDDFFYDENVIKTIAETFVANPDQDAVVGDIVFLNAKNENKILRRYSSKRWKPNKFAWGYMPAHPSFFVKKEYYEQFGGYKLKYRIAADYELLIRFLLIHKINWNYIPLVTTKMRPGGNSTAGIKTTIKLNKEILEACKENGVTTNYLKIYSKYFFKPFEFIT